MENYEIRRKIKERRLYQYQIAAKLGVSECTLIRWLRTKLSPQKEKQILSAIAELEQEVG